MAGSQPSVTRPNYDRRTHNDAYDNGTFVSRGPESHFFNNSTNNYRFGAAVISQYAPWLHGLAPYFSYNSTFTPVNSLQNDGTPARSRPQQKLGSGKPVARAEQPAEYHGGSPQDSGPESCGRH